MRVGVDEPRRHNQSVGLDRAFRSSVHLAHGDDAAVLDGDVSGVRLLARPVDDQGILDDQVVDHALAPVTRGSSDPSIRT
jgi:hypothetical protein